MEVQTNSRDVVYLLHALLERSSLAEVEHLALGPPPNSVWLGFGDCRGRGETMLGGLRPGGPPQTLLNQAEIGAARLESFELQQDKPVPGVRRGLDGF